LDLIIANDVSDSSIGFDSDENEVYLITEKIEKKIEKISKKKLSRSIIEFIAKYL
jgi:phosphopantothenoylcysteine decarboxylase/phosphopantothenate--cysteine ligase|tara:strand:+ start:324 stop:488 length:165 start_codon:yes stop_codon:yes gene_type:complete